MWESRAGRKVTENERIREGSGNKDKMLGKREREREEKGRRGKNKNAIRMTEKRWGKRVHTRDKSVGRKSGLGNRIRKSRSMCMAVYVRKGRQIRKK